MIKQSLALIGLTLSLSANAATVNYSESADGELGFLNTTFTLNEAGVNTISGSLSNSTTGFDNDSFFLSLDSSVVITGFSFVYSNGTEVGTNFDPNWALQELDGSTFLSTGDYDISTDSNSGSVSVAPPYTFDSYRVWLGGGTFGASDPGYSASADWIVSIETTAVPIPAAAWLFGSALLGLGIVKRYKA